MFHVLFSDTDPLLVQAELARICSLYADLKAWIKPKRHPWMQCGITKAFSKIAPEWWDNAPKTSNNSESSHAEDYSHAGRKGSMLGASLSYELCIYRPYAKYLLTVC